MQRQSRIDRMFDEIIVDACGYDEQLWAFQTVLDEDIACPVDAFVLGEPVEVVKVDYDGNERRGITATCRKNETEWVVSVADVVFEAGSPAADLVDAYRKPMGLKSVGRARAGEKKHKAEVAEIAIGEAVDVAILAAKGRTTRVRLLESGRQLTLRKGLWAVPGEIATVMPKRVWSFNGHGRHCAHTRSLQRVAGTGDPCQPWPAAVAPLCGQPVDTHRRTSPTCRAWTPPRT